MDPYLERHWGDIHHRLVQYACDALQSGLPDDLRARVEERVYVETDVPERGRYIQPDVRVIEPPRRGGGASTAGGTGSGAAGGTAVLEAPTEAPAEATDPVVLSIGSEPVTEGVIQIIDVRSGGRVVTLIEVVSPGNKAGGEGEGKYRQKQQEARAAGASTVEIDLVRGGNYVLVAPRGCVPPQYLTPYRVCVWRASQPQVAAWYPVAPREPLPKIRVPLRATDKDVVLDLQALLVQAYRNGRYDDIDYRGDPDPPLGPDEAKWADGLLRSRGLR